MPVITRSQSKKQIETKLKPIDEKISQKTISIMTEPNPARALKPSKKPSEGHDTKAYKLVNLTNSGNKNIDPAIAVLIIPEEIESTIERQISGNPDYAKYRAECAYVEEFTDLTGKPLFNVRIAYSIHKPYGLANHVLVYKKGQFVYPEYYTKNINIICGGGIHFYLTQAAVLSYYINGSNSNLKNIQILPELYLPFSLYKPIILDGNYKIYNNNGQCKCSVEYIDGILQNYSFKIEHKLFLTNFEYRFNSITDCILVKIMTSNIIDMNETINGLEVFNTVIDVKQKHFPKTFVSNTKNKSFGIFKTHI